MIVVDVDGIVSVMSKNTSQENLLIPVHAVARRKHKANINEGFHRHLKISHKINLSDKGSIHQYFQGVLFALYAWNAGTVNGT